MPQHYERGLRSRVLAVATLLAAALLQAAGAAGQVPPELADYLRKAAGFDQRDIAALEAGRVIAKAESGSTNTELFAVAAVKIRAPRSQVAAYYGQMVSWVDGLVTLGFGRFSTPPALADVAELSLDRADIDALSKCRPGNCDLRVGGAGIDKLRGAVDWKSPDAADQVQAMVRRAIVEYVAGYQARGDAALITYDDTSKPVSLAGQWQGILAASPYFYQYLPALRDYLAQYPSATLTGARDLFYWVKENFGFKPTISVVHAVVFQPPTRSDRTIVVQKQIYASHYYDGSLAVATLIDGPPESSGPVTYLVYGNRSRGDLLKGGFGGLKRAAAREQARKAAEETLQTIQSTLETAPVK